MVAIPAAARLLRLVHQAAVRIELHLAQVDVRERVLRQVALVPADELDRVAVVRHHRTRPLSTIIDESFQFQRVASTFQIQRVNS
jgi:hypothetical protein